MVVLLRPLAVNPRKPCQIRKEAAVANGLGVGQGGEGHHHSVTGASIWPILNENASSECSHTGVYAPLPPSAFVQPWLKYKRP
jgi:hypothetical protein